MDRTGCIMSMVGEDGMNKRRTSLIALGVTLSLPTYPIIFKPVTPARLRAILEHLVHPV